MLILFISEEEKTIQIYKYDEYEKKQNVQIVIKENALERRKDNKVNSLAYYETSADAWICEYGDGLEFCCIQIIPDENPATVKTFCPVCGWEISISVSHMPTSYLHSCGHCNTPITIKSGP